MDKLFRFLKKKETASVKQQIGNTAEKIAALFLQKQGLRFIATQFRTKRGEIDLIMRDKDIWVFVEVRYRTDPNYGSPKESIDYFKQQKIIYAAHIYLQKNKLIENASCRYDVVAVTGNLMQPQIEWVQAAFGG